LVAVPSLAAAHRLLADYLLPTASDLPTIRTDVTDTHPSPINDLGANGGSKGGIISVGEVTANAVAAALNAFGVEPCAAAFAFSDT